MLDDRVITLDLLTSAKEEVSAYARACNETASIELRQVLSQQLQKAQQSQQKIFEFAKNKGYYDPFKSPEQMLSQDLQASSKLLSQTQSMR